MVLLLTMSVIGSGLLATCVDRARATTVHTFAGSFGGAASDVVDPYPLGAPKGVAVDRTASGNGDIYVADSTHARVEKFDAAGQFVLMFGKGVDITSGGDVCTAASGDTCGAGEAGTAGLGELDEPRFVSVDNSTGPAAGDVYVADPTAEAVYEFNSAGEYLGVNVGAAAPGGPFGRVAGIAVGPTGNLWVFNFNGTMFEFNESGTFLNEWATSGAFPGGIAVEPNEDLLVVNGFSEAVLFLPSGEKLGALLSLPAVGVTADPVGGDEYVGTGTTIEHFAPSCDPSLGSCAPTETFGAPQLIGGSGLSVGPSGVVYAADESAGIVDVFGVSLEANTGPASEVASTSAIVSGTVNPEGAAVSSCFFEYGTSTEYGEVVACDSAVGTGNAPVSVKATITGLQGNTTYHYRLVAKNAKAVVRSDDHTFSTSALASINSASVENLSSEAADLVAQIDPHGLAASYRFEWGTTTSYGSTTPVPDGSLSASSGSRVVTAHLADLHPDIEYHWRVVVTDENGTVVGADHTFAYLRTLPALPDGRHYELVTPSNKNGSLIGALFLRNIPPQISEDGGRLMAPTVQCFAHAEGCTGARHSEGEPYEFKRTVSGWIARSLAPSAQQFQANTYWDFDIGTGGVLYTLPSESGGDKLYGRSSDGSLNQIGPIGAPGSTTFEDEIRLVTATSGFSHLTYTTNKPLWPFDATSAAPSLYEYPGPVASEPELVGVTGARGSTSLVSKCGTLSTAKGGVHDIFGTLSNDGRTAYFTAFPCSSGAGANSGVAVPSYQLYARIDQERTQLVSGRSATDCSSPSCMTSPPGDAAFEGASGDGARVFFTDTQQLTDQASEDSGDSAANDCRATSSIASGCNLYESECPNHCVVASERVLVDVSSGDSSGEGPRVRGVMGISPDGTHVYFVARGVLTNAPNEYGRYAHNGAENLYAYERDASAPEGRMSFVATLSSADAAEWTEVGAANVTPEGRFLVFTSHRALTPDASRDEGPQQVYRYDSQAHALIRVSIGENGYNNDGNSGSGDASIARADIGIIDRMGPARTDATMSHDGSYVFFMSPVGLTPSALNDVEIGETGRFAQNIYEYHEGHVYLLSDGKDINEASKISPNEVELLGSDASGANVFFATADQLVPEDTDTQRDYYDVHICTQSDPCPAQAPTSPMPCGEIETCRGGGLTLPGPSQAGGSSVVTGEGNVRPGPSVAAASVAVVGHSFRAGKLRLRLRVSAGGQIRVSGLGIRPTVHAAGGAGTYTVAVALNRRAKTSLRRRQHRARLTIQVGFTASAGSLAHASIQTTVKGQ